MAFRWRERQGRPPVELVLHETTAATWDKFKEYHYLTSDLNKSAHCYVAEANGVPVAFCAIRYQPLSSFPCWMFHRAVTMPEWQGIGIALLLFSTLAETYQQLPPHRVRVTPRHPGLCRAFARSPHWRCVRAMGPSTRRGRGRAGVVDRSGLAVARGEITATFEWVG